VYKKTPDGTYSSENVEPNVEPNEASSPTLFSGGRPEGSKRNLKFQSATWHHFKFVIPLLKGRERH
jgi:hypothetical protein